MHLCPGSNSRCPSASKVKDPASAILLGDFKLIRVYETDQRRLFDLSKDVTEQNDLAGQMPAKVTELDQRLANYLKAVNAQMPTLNPVFDPAKATPFQERKGGRKRQEAVQ